MTLVTLLLNCQTMRSSASPYLRRSVRGPFVVFARIVAGSVDLHQPVEGLMTTEPRTLDLDDTIRDAIVLMQTGRYRNVPVVDEARQLVGVVRQSDIIKYLAESFPEALLNLPPRPHQRMKEPEGA